MRQHIKQLAHTLCVTSIFCLSIGGTVLLVQHVEAHGLMRAALRFLKGRSSPTIMSFMDRAIRPALFEHVLDPLEPGDTLYLAAFVMTDPAIADKLIEKRNAGVNIEIIADTSGIAHESSQLPRLAHAGVPVGLLPSLHEHPSDRAPLHHNKFVLGAHNGIPFLVTGSCNFTRSAYDKHWENCVIITGDYCLDEQYREYFRTLKGQAVKIEDIILKIKKK